MIATASCHSQTAASPGAKVNEPRGSSRETVGATPGLTAQPAAGLELDQERAFAASYLPLVAIFADRFRQDIEPHLSEVPERWPYSDRVVAFLSQELRRDVARYHSRTGGDLASLFDPGQLKNLDGHLSSTLHSFLHRLWALPCSARAASAPPKPSPRVRKAKENQRARPARQRSEPQFQVVLKGDDVEVKPLRAGNRQFTSQRMNRIILVLTKVFSFQRAFLSSGVHGLRALTLAQVAERCGLHESTLSRLSTTVAVETPRGVYPLRWFFSSSLRGYDGGTVSSRSAIELVRETVEECAARGVTVTDHQIVRILRLKGVGLARRTVAKYRAKLGIPAAKTRDATGAAGGPVPEALPPS